MSSRQEMLRLMIRATDNLRATLAQQAEPQSCPDDAACRDETVRRLRAEVERLRKATQLCDKHAPNGGTVATCVICSGQKLSYALSRISYLCGTPNEMECSSYDLHYNEDAVVAQVERLRAQQSEPVREWRGLTDEEIDALLRAIKEGQR